MARCFSASDSLRISAAAISPPSPPCRLLLPPRLRFFHLRRFSAQYKAGVRRLVSRVSPVNEIVVDGAANAAVTTQQLDLKSEEDITSEKSLTTQNEETISSVLADVANLVKLVDSRDIVELELKHQHYELIIRKKEALEQNSPAQANSVQPQMIHAPMMYPSYGLAPSPSPNPAPVNSPVVTEVTPTETTESVSTPASNLPRILSPMAGTFYKSPGPGEPAFVKVGDRVTKGQVICIVEAMKLMNEIESDQTGTIVEILVGDGKPVSIDMPLFAIKP